jgi:hypothetical protein
MKLLLSLFLLFMLDGPFWKLVPVATGTVVWYEHDVTSVDRHINPWTRKFVALQNDWDRRPYPVIIKIGDRAANADRRDVTRSKYVAEMSPALCVALGLDFGYNDVAYGKWQAEIFAIERI